MESWESAAVALAIGLLIGSERERSKRETGSAGVRSFALVALLGLLATRVPLGVGVVMAAGVALLVAAGYWATRSEDPGLTSEVALLTTLGLGALAGTEPALAAGAAVAVTVLLVSKDALHRFLRDTVTDLEGSDALKFFVAAFIVLPLLPDEPVDSYGVLIPSKVWLLVVLITGIGWVGYAATRALGARRGLLVSGLAGGFVSGAATTGAMGARHRSGDPLSATLAGALMASVATLLQLAAVTVVVDPTVTAALAPAVVAGSVVLLVEAWVLARRTPRGDGDDEHPGGRPFSLWPALVLAAVISAVLVLAAWLTDLYGAAAISVVSATGSLADFHASAAAVATLVRSDVVTMPEAMFALGLGLVTNTGSKLLAGAAAGGRRFAGGLLLAFAPVAVVVAVALYTAARLAA